MTKTNVIPTRNGTDADFATAKGKDDPIKDTLNGYMGKSIPIDYNPPQKAPECDGGNAKCVSRKINSGEITKARPDQKVRN